MQNNMQESTQEEKKQDGVQRLFAPRQASEQQNKQNQQPQQSQQTEDSLQQKADEAAVMAANESSNTDAAIFQKHLRENGPSEIINLKKAMVDPASGGRTGRISLFNTMTNANKQQLMGDRTFSKDEMRKQFKARADSNKEMLDAVAPSAIESSKNIAKESAFVSNLSNWGDVSKDEGVNRLAKIMSAAGAARHVKMLADADAAYSRYKDVVDRMGNDYSAMLDTYKTDALFADAVSKMATANASVIKAGVDKSTKVYEAMHKELMEGKHVDESTYYRYSSAIMGLYERGDIEEGMYDHLMASLVKSSLPSKIKDSLNKLGYTETDPDYVAMVNILSNPEKAPAVLNTANNATIVYGNRTLNKEAAAQLKGLVGDMYFRSKREQEKDSIKVKRMKDNIEENSPAFRGLSNYLSWDDSAAFEEAMQNICFSGNTEDHQVHYATAREVLEKAGYVGAFDVISNGMNLVGAFSINEALQKYTPSQQRDALNKYGLGLVADILEAKRARYNNFMTAFSYQPEKDKAVQELLNKLQSSEEIDINASFYKQLGAQLVTTITNAYQNIDRLSQGKVVPKWEDIQSHIRDGIFASETPLLFDTTKKEDVAQISTFEKLGYKFMVSGENGEKRILNISPEDLTSRLLKNQMVSGAVTKQDVLGDPALLSSLRLAAPGLSIKAVADSAQGEAFRAAVKQAQASAVQNGGK